MEKHARVICSAGGGQSNNCSVFCSSSPNKCKADWVSYYKPIRLEFRTNMEQIEIYLTSVIKIVIGIFPLKVAKKQGTKVGRISRANSGRHINW